MIEKVSGVVNFRAMEGVAFLLSKWVLDGVMEYRDVSARLMWVNTEFEGKVRVFVSVYSPESERSWEERNTF